MIPKEMKQIFRGIQAISTATIAGVTLWALLFTPLPEALITQLRVEISEAKSEVENLRREKGRLQEERRKTGAEVAELKLKMEKLEDELEVRKKTRRTLEIQNKELKIEQENMLSENQTLRKNRDELKQSIKTLENERGIYAEATVRQATAKLFAVAENRLATYEFFAKIATEYHEHSKWVKANHELEKLLAEYMAVPEKERFEKFDSVFNQFIELQMKTFSPPKIWLEEPAQPRLEPVADPMGEIIEYGNAWPEALRLMEITKKNVGERYSHYDYKLVNQWLTNYFFDHTVTKRGNRAETGGTFISNLKTEKILQNLLPSEFSVIEHLLDDFLKSYPELRSMKIKLVFEQEPTIQETLTEGQEILKNVRHFREKFMEFRESKLLSSKI